MTSREQRLITKENILNSLGFSCYVDMISYYIRKMKFWVKFHMYVSKTCFLKPGHNCCYCQSPIFWLGLSNVL